MEKKLKARGTDLNFVLIKPGFFPRYFQNFRQLQTKLNRFYFSLFPPLKIKDD